MSDQTTIFTHETNMLISVCSWGFWSWLKLKICTILYAYSLYSARGKLFFPQHLPGSSNGVPNVEVILLCLPSEICFQMFYFFTFFCNRQQREPPLGAKAFLNFLFEMESEFEAGHRLARSGL